MDSDEDILDILDIKYEENLNNIPITLNFYNIYDDFFTHLTDFFLFYELFDKLNISTLLKLRFVNKQMNDIIKSYMLFNNKTLLINNIKNSYSFLFNPSSFLTKSNTYKLLVNNYINNYDRKLIIPIDIINGNQNIFIVIRDIKRYVRKNNISYNNKILTFINRYRRRIYCRYCLNSVSVKWYNFVIALINK